MPDAVAQSSAPIICFGQQPCGFFPKRFLFAKIVTARRLKKEIGGEIVFFYHDSDHDPRETRTTVHHRQSGNPILLNFEFENKWQRKFSPLYLKRVPSEWSRKMTRQLGNYVDKPWIEAFHAVAAGPQAHNVADFCLDMYRHMGLLDGIRVMRSSDPAFRRAACEISDFFVDVPYENEIVRARPIDGKFQLHEGGNAYITVPSPPIPVTREQISPTRDSRLVWMQSVVHCTHYVSGAGEQAYLRKEEAPEITFVTRDPIERSDEAYTDLPQNGAPPPLLAFGAHPDDVEFGCGGVILNESRAGRPAHLVICSRGEAGTHGTPEERTQEAERGAAFAGATLEFAQFDGDAHLELRTAHALKIAELLRRHKPAIVLAPTPDPNQHPDHARLGQLVRDAARLARYGSLPELKPHAPHTIDALFFYEVTTNTTSSPTLLVDVSDVIPQWTAAMEAHASQLRTRNYIEFQLTRARLNGLRAGVAHAIALHPNDPLVVTTLAPLARTARTF